MPTTIPQEETLNSSELFAQPVVQKDQSVKDDTSTAMTGPVGGGLPIRFRKTSIRKMKQLQALLTR